MTFEINKKLLEEGKIELMKEKLNELEVLAKLNGNFTANAMMAVIEKYNFIKDLEPEIDTDTYDNRLKEIILSSNKKHLFY